MEKSITTEAIPIRISNFSLTCHLTIPENATSIVVFSHGSGSLSSCNRFVAGYLQDQGFATLLFDLLTPEEDLDYSRRFDIKLLTERLIIVTNWLQQQEQTKGLAIGYFGTSTGAASALAAAAVLRNRIKAVVSQSGRPDLAAKILHTVKTPTLLLTGSRDEAVTEMNQQAYELLQTEKQLELMPGATRHSEETGALERVAELAADWFGKYLVKGNEKTVFNFALTHP